MCVQSDGEQAVTAVERIHMFTSSFKHTQAYCWATDGKRDQANGLQSKVSKKNELTKRNFACTRGAQTAY